MLGISSLLKNTWILRNTSCNTWRRYISVNDRRRMNSASQWRHRMTVHMEETLPCHHLLLRACKISWRQSTSGFFGVLRSYNCLFVSPYSKIPFYSSLPTTILLQFWIFSFPTTSLTSSSHLTLCLPILLTATDYTELSLSIFTICPIYLIFYAFIYLTNAHIWLAILFTH